MNLIHFSSQKVIKLVSKDADAAGSRRILGKPPGGFWVSVEGKDDGWYDWCQAESFNLENLKYHHEVKLKSNAKILYIRSAEELNQFGDKYKTSDDPWSPSIMIIDWAKVAKDYQGIIIAPYIEDIEDEWLGRQIWYYGWDCASGCIWDIEAIEALERD